MNKLEELKQKRQEIDEEIKVLECERNYSLTCRVYEKCLAIGYWVDNCFYIVGDINNNGECRFLNTEERRVLNKRWMDNGCKCSDESVAWKSLLGSVKKYFIDQRNNHLVSEVSNGSRDYLFCFDYDCTIFDDNIQTYKDGTLKLF